MIAIIPAFLFNWLLVYMAVGIFISSHSATFIVSLTTMFAFLWLSQTKAAEQFLRWNQDARKAVTQEKNIVMPMLETLSKRAGLKTVPALYVLDTDGLEAYALGKNTIGISTGMLKKASDAELYGVLAHEIAHLKYKDSVKGTTIYSLNIAGWIALLIIHGILILATFLANFAGRIGIIGAAVAFLSLVLKLFVEGGCKLLVFIRCASMRKAEFRADQFAVEVGGGQGLISILEKMAQYEQAINRWSRKKTNQKRGIIGKLEATHPPIMERIERIEKFLQNNNTI
ncbi:M48 family metalloprotease [Aneurinibacillus thermoaerophilus]|uniref:M48 family metalloprotease n=1 Tax=Aneurinibacillus thermoaerophilus TaxID=143495 RepID=UPI002E1F1969|nr:M48 family metalloprotease [Aneurinibacillus thermoaerophilus]MED0739038.1 M48 family metalloprotease [Aneurinibacillus thermoaerophilus]